MVMIPSLLLRRVGYLHDLIALAVIVVTASQNLRSFVMAITPTPIYVGIATSIPG
jgi:hypothetical protein